MKNEMKNDTNSHSSFYVIEALFETLSKNIICVICVRG